MITRAPAQFLHHRLRRMTVAAVLLVAEASLLALAGFWWWPVSLLALVPLVLLARATVLGGPLDPVAVRIGIRGEERVARVLAELEAEGHVALHDLDTGRGNADHVLVGPAGVFVIETKEWRGRFFPKRGQLMFNERPADDVVAQATAAALAVRSRLERARVDAWVQPVIASTRASVYGSPMKLRHVTVLEADHLPDFVRRRQVRMDAVAVRTAVAAILDDRSV